ncbi:MAG: SHD1 domain-containing protein, partial [Thermogutta sp.]
PAPAENPTSPAPAENPAPQAPAPAAPPAPETPAAPATEAAPAPAQSGYRIWTDESGMYRITARFVQTIDGETVRLRTPSGAFVRVAWDRLSQADRDYVIRLGGVAANLR